jgi:hypothetical protein
MQSGTSLSTYRKDNSAFLSTVKHCAKQETTKGLTNSTAMGFNPQGTRRHISEDSALHVCYCWYKSAIANLITLYMSQLLVISLNNDNRANFTVGNSYRHSLEQNCHVSFCNPILFAICTRTLGKLCKNLYSGM